MLVAPSEPPRLKRLGESSSVPERYGADFLWTMPKAEGDGTRGLVGVQRKEWKDLLVSVADGRLQKEVAQMTMLRLAVLIVEGSPSWTIDGQMTSRYHQRWSRPAFRNLLRSVAAEGIQVEMTDGMDDTAAAIESLWHWTQTEHKTLRTRPKSKTDGWGHRESSAWQSHLLQGMPGMGATRAEAFVKHFGGVPLAWTVGVKEMMEVDGIGKKTAETLWNLLMDDDDGDGGDG